ncbi:MAG: twin-arginine translocase TatA/TatE family subunit [Acidimicrobiia bacterium]|nr:twin-arginine translocase TatA/TatE family subunit [Acidimicrobiia bacterium]
MTSPAHLGVVLIVALVVLGPERLPGALRQVAQFVSAVRRVVDEVNQTVAAATPNLRLQHDEVGRSPASTHELVTVEPAGEIRT